MTQADRALLERVPLNGTSLIDVYKWLIHNHFIKSTRATIDSAKNELVYSFTYDPKYKRYANYIFYLHIKANMAWTKDMNQFEGYINTYFLTDKLYETSPISFSEYLPRLEENETMLFYMIMETPKGDTVFID